MAGTRAGALKAVATNKRLYGDSFYKVVGKKGGETSTGGGFASTKIGPDGLTGPERARIVGSNGGKTSRRYHREG